MQDNVNGLLVRLQLNVILVGAIMSQRPMAHPWPGFLNAQLMMMMVMMMMDELTLTWHIVLRLQGHVTVCNFQRQFVQ